MKRRHFLGASAALAASLSQPNWLLALDPNNRYRKAIGLQLYTLRNPIRDDVEGTLKAVAEAGYQQVEPYGFPNADAMIKAAKDNGMAVHSSHINTDGILFPERKGVQPIEELIEKAKDVGLTHMVIPWLPNNLRDSLDKYKTLAEKCNVAAEKTQAAGIQLSYHNHAFEFQPMEGGRCGYDVLMDEFSEAMQFEIDTFWVKVGGHDPAKLIRQLKGRVTQLHLKRLGRFGQDSDVRRYPAGSLQRARQRRDRCRALVGRRRRKPAWRTATSNKITRRIRYSASSKA